MALHNKKASPVKGTELLDYKDIDLLRRFITEQGKILPRRLTSKQQKKLTKAIKQARILALLPFLNKD